MSRREARARITRELTAPGAEFALESAVIRGIETPVYTAAPASLRDIVAQAARWGDRPAITYEDEQVSWAEFDREVGRFAAALQHTLGVAQGDRVAIALRNYPEWPVAFAAVVAAGAVCVPLNSWWSAAELAAALADSGAVVLVADAERAAGVQGRRDALPQLRHVIEVRPGESAQGDLDWKSLLAADRPAFDPDAAPVAPDDDATILYTSGTTGRPKGAVATHRAHVTTFMNLRAHAAIEAALARLEGEDEPALPNPSTTLVPGPLFHVSYLPRAVAAPANGSHLVLMYKWDARRAIELIERERVDGLVAVPMVMRQLLDEFERRGARPPTLRSLGTGGAQSTAALIGRIRTQFPGPIRSGTGYGMTETCGPMLMIGSRDYFEHPLAVGRPLPAARVRIVTADGRDAAPGEVGEAWFAGASVARGYWSGADGGSGEGFAADGWLRTGDLVTQDEEGLVSIVDRLKDIVIRAGENVYCSEVEEALGAHPEVLDCAVLGIPHELWGEAVAAVVQRRPGSTLTAEALQDFVRGRLAYFKIPTTVHFVSTELPRNAAGKVLKRELRGIVPTPTPDTPATRST